MIQNNIKVISTRQQNLNMIEKELRYKYGIEKTSKELLDLIVYIAAKNMQEFINLLCDNKE
ncbi:hypothetical protein NYE67_18525 [Solibacillus sp. FSL W8-0474]|uniref:hypothetical protein n=1 Tax=Solibacillus sp. FSL W8-0474 TaxID=2975336 RepID=UPI0030F74B9C